MTVDDQLRGLVQRLSSALGEDLLSVVLYGSAAGGDFHEQHSDLNVLCVLRQVRARELERVAGPLRWWLEQGQTAPLLLSEEEIRDSADVFPIEFLDIRAGYRLLHGADLVAAIEVSMANHRRQLEHELRSRLLRLRRRFLETQHDNQTLARLMLDSVSTFATLFRHALVAAGLDAPVRKPEIFRAAAERFAIGPAPFDALLEVRSGARKLDPAEVRGWFDAYLEGITRMAERVDQLDR
jgi:predicted nucleotidyltransferase